MALTQLLRPSKELSHRSRRPCRIAPMLAVCNLHGNGSAVVQSRFALPELQTDRIKPVRKCLGTQRSKTRNHGFGNLRASHVDQRLWDVWVPRIAAREPIGFVTV